MKTTIKNDYTASRNIRKWLRYTVDEALGPKAELVTWAGPFGSDRVFVVESKWNRGAYIEFVTHRVNGRTGALDVGHYFDHRDEAHDDFLYRAEQEKRYAA